MYLMISFELLFRIDFIFFLGITLLMKHNTKRKIIKKLLIDLELDSGISQEQLAKAIGVDRVSLNYALTGQRESQRYVDILDSLHVYLIKI